MNSRYIKQHISKILSLILCVALVSAVYFVPASATHSNYNNKSDYWLANWYGLDELPYGSDTGVVYIYWANFQDTNSVYGRGDLTLCFDKCTYMERYHGDVSASIGGIDYVILDDYPNSHIWGMKSGSNFSFTCISDHPVLYTWSNTGEDWKQLPWTYCFTSEYTSVADGTGIYTTTTTLYVYVDINLNSVCGAQTPTGSYTWGLYSNSLMVNNLSGNWDKTEDYSVTFNVPKDSHNKFNNWNNAIADCPYIFEAYPTTAALMDWDLYYIENAIYNTLSNYLKSIDDTLYMQLDELYVISDTLQAILDGQDYPEGGLFNNTSDSDVIDGAIGEISSDTSAADYIHTLAVSFEFIRKLWDKIVGVFGFGSIIGLLLFLAFVAYLLGRALKGRSD